MDNWSSRIFLLLIGFILQESYSARIISLNTVDPVIKDSGKSVRLVCEYTVEDESDLIVQWYFKTDNNLVYQWVPGKSPDVLGLLKGKLMFPDTSKSGSETRIGGNVRSSTLFISEPGYELSGKYICKVSELQGEEDSRSTNLVIYTPAKHVNMTYSKPTDETVNVTCNVEGVYPLPNIELVVDQSRKSKYTLEGVQTISTQNPDGTYDVAVSKVEFDRVLPEKVKFECTMSIPETNEYTRRSVFYSRAFPEGVSDGDDGDDWSNGRSTSICPSSWLVTSLVITLAKIFAL